MNDLTPNAIVLHRDFYDVLQKLDDTQRGRLLLALYEYAFDDEETTELDAITNIAYSVIARTIDMNTKRYREISEKRRQAAIKGGGAPVGNKNAAKIKTTQKQPTQKNKTTETNKNKQNKQNKQMFVVSETPENTDVCDTLQKTTKTNKTNKTNYTNTNTNTNTNYKNTAVAVQKATAAAAVSFQAKKIIDFWNERCTNMPKVAELTDARARELDHLLQVYTPDEICDCLMIANQSPTLNGERNERPMKIDWCLKNFLSLYEDRITLNAQKQKAQEAQEAAMQRKAAEQRRAIEQQNEQQRHTCACVPMPDYILENFRKRRTENK